MNFYQIKVKIIKFAMCLFVWIKINKLQIMQIIKIFYHFLLNLSQNMFIKG